MRFGNTIVTASVQSVRKIRLLYQIIGDKIKDLKIECMQKVFTASRLLNLFAPDQVIFNERGITFHVRKLFSGTENFVFYSDISGVEIESGIFFSTIHIIPRARPEITIKNFTKGDAREIRRLIMERA